MSDLGKVTLRNGNEYDVEEGLFGEEAIEIVEGELEYLMANWDMNGHHKSNRDWDWMRCERDGDTIFFNEKQM